MSEHCCSFCGKGNNSVKQMIVGAKANICDECTDICMEILKTDNSFCINHVKKFYDDVRCVEVRKKRMPFQETMHSNKVVYIPCYVTYVDGLVTHVIEDKGFQSSVLAHMFFEGVCEGIWGMNRKRNCCFIILQYDINKYFSYYQTHYGT